MEQTMENLPPAGCEFRLELWGHQDPQLNATCFSHPLLKDQIVAVRGSGFGTVGERNSFRWSSAVRALTYFFVRAKLSETLPDPCEELLVMEGEARSAAASLDYALARNSTWLSEIFGADRYGLCLARRILRRSNPERKRPGPVRIALSTGILRPENIEIFLNRRAVTNSTQLTELCAALASNWPVDNAKYTAFSALEANDRAAA